MRSSVRDSTTEWNVELKPDVLFGNPEEWATFGERNGEFLRRFRNLKAALDTSFIRALASPEQIDTVLFLTSRQAVDDFMEILLLCGNSEGHGAEKLLRSFFERVVLVGYLHRHPEKLDDYFDYFHVSQWKFIDSAIRTWGREAFDVEKVEEARRSFEKVKERYRGRKCKACGQAEMGIAWSPMALQDMAKAAGLERYVFYAYSAPLVQVHPTFKSTMQRLELGGEEALSYGDRVDRGLADRVLMTAHALLIQLLALQVERFGVPGLEVQVRQAERDFAASWDREPASARLAASQQDSAG